MLYKLLMFRAVALHKRKSGQCQSMLMALNAVILTGLAHGLVAVSDLIVGL